MTVIHEYTPAGSVSKIKYGDIIKDKQGNLFGVVECFSPFIKFMSLDNGQYTMLDEQTTLLNYTRV